MTNDDNPLIQRLRFLMRVVSRESAYLEATDVRLFDQPFDADRARRLPDDEAEAERVDAFVSRFGRLQDTLGNKVLPVYLKAVGETVGAMLDNLDRAERLELVSSADHWFTVRNLRNQMVHEYIEDPEILSSALQSGHEFVPVLVHTAHVFKTDMTNRGWLHD